MKAFWLIPLGLICGVLIGNIVEVELISWIGFFLSIIFISFLIRVILNNLCSSKNAKENK